MQPLSKKNAKKSTPLCFCGSHKYFLECCQPYLQGLKLPEPEALMRSRYCAYVLEDWQYLTHTWHPDTCPKDLCQTVLSPKWLGLTIVRTEIETPQLAWVEFIARSKLAGHPAERLHEKSQFIHNGTQWLYVDGIFMEKS